MKKENLIFDKNSRNMVRTTIFLLYKYTNKKGIMLKNILLKISNYISN